MGKIVLSGYLWIFGQYNIRYAGAIPVILGVLLVNRAERIRAVSRSMSLVLQ